MNEIRGGSRPVNSSSSVTSLQLTQFVKSSKLTSLCYQARSDVHCTVISLNAPTIVPITACSPSRDVFRSFLTA